MAPPEDFYPPVTYGSIWTVAAVVALVAVAGWWIGWWWCTRARRDRTPVWRPLRGAALTARRARAIDAIDGVRRAHDAGLTTTRDAFQQLSPLVRQFVFDAAGVPAHTMTLADLEREHPGVLADAVALMYPVEFAAEVDGDVGLGAERARQVVLEWEAEPATRVGS